MQDEEGGESSSSSNPLDAYASNLNELARQGRIDPLVGRETEVERVAQILARRRKNNPLLVGEAGVGKTAIAEGLAKRIVDNQVPDLLANSIVYSLDLRQMSEVQIAQAGIGRKFQKPTVFEALKIGKSVV